MSVFSRIFARKDPREQAREAYDRVVALGREPYWYLDGGVPDSVDGRFETVMTVLCAVLLRLEGDDADSTVRHFSVYLAELFVDDIDGLGLRIGQLGSDVGGCRALRYSH